MRRLAMIALTLAAFGALVVAQSALAGEMGQKAVGEMQTMVGTINMDGRFQTADGSEYLIVGEKAEDVMLKQGEKVKLTGSLQSEGDTKAIAVKDFKVLDAYEFQNEMKKQDMEKTAQ